MEINTETIFVAVSVILYLVGIIFVMIGIYAYQKKPHVLLCRNRHRCF